MDVDVSRMTITDRGPRWCIGAFVTDAVVASEAVGRVEEERFRDDGTPELLIQWIRPRTRGRRWCRPQDLRGGLRLGQSVAHRPPGVCGSISGVGVVRDLRMLGGREQVLVDFPGQGSRLWLPVQHLMAVRGVELLFAHGKLDPWSADERRLRLRCLAHALELWDENTGSLSHLHIDPLPHQIHVVHTILRSGNLNWLMADDVGLGKTIEVGMLLSALSRRRGFRRILIVCPPGVARQWQEELRLKFEMDDFEIHGVDFHVHEGFRWKLHDHVIASMDRLKQERDLELLLSAAPWDMIVFDEAHRLSRRQYGAKFEASQRFMLARSLRRKSDHFIFLTATPHQGKEAGFQGLLELLRPERKRAIRNLEFNPKILADMVIRNNKAEVTDAEGNLLFKGKITRTVTVSSSDRVREFDNALRDYLRRGYAAGEKRGRTGIAIGFVMTVYRKLAASSAAAINIALKRRLQRLEESAGSVDMEDMEKGNSTPQDTDHDMRYEGEFEEKAVALSPREFFTGEVSALHELITMTEVLLAEDAKKEAFLEQVADICAVEGEAARILIFTEYRATQEYLAEALSARYGKESVGLIHGSQSADERLAVIEGFEQDFRFLVSTEAGGEGINLHHNCHIMVNYDLPWNPMRLVQRVGRLYRYGQSQRVVIFNMRATETLDGKIVEKMYERLDQISRDMASIGTEYADGLQDDIFGELASFMDLDVADILARARGTHATRTQDEINRAIERAREATRHQNELFAFASRYAAGTHLGELGIDQRHVSRFVEGMFELLGVEVRKKLHGDREWEVFLSDVAAEAAGREARLVRVTLDRTWAAAHPGTEMLDIDSPLMRFLLQQATKLSFGGRATHVSGFEGKALLAAVMRWQDSSGQRMRQEFAMTAVDASGNCRVNTPDLAEWLLANDRQSNVDPGGQDHKMLLERASAAIDTRLAERSNSDLHPENLEWIAAGWP